MEQPRRNTDAGFQVIKLFIGPPSLFCLKGLEAQGVLQRHTDKDLGAFSHGFMLTEISLSVAPSPAPGRESGREQIL